MDTTERKTTSVKAVLLNAMQQNPDAATIADIAALLQQLTSINQKLADFIPEAVETIAEAVANWQQVSAVLRDVGGTIENANKSYISPSLLPPTTATQQGRVRLEAQNFLPIRQPIFPGTRQPFWKIDGSPLVSWCRKGLETRLFFIILLPSTAPILATLRCTFHGVPPLINSYVVS